MSSRIECFDYKGKHCSDPNDHLCVAKSVTVEHHMTKKLSTRYYVRVCTFKDVGAMYDPEEDHRSDLFKYVNSIGKRLFEFQEVNEKAYIDYVMYLHSPTNRARLRAAQRSMRNG